MQPQFWKLSHGKNCFTDEELLDAINARLAYVYKDTGPVAGSRNGQGVEFSKAAVGDYFYLTHGNRGILVVGQFSGPANVFSEKKGGWLDRPYRFIRTAKRPRKRYVGPKKQWAPSYNSTFARVPDNELSLFEEHILKPYFEIKLAEFGLA